MRIGCPGIGPSETLQQMLSMMADGSPETEGAIDMHPCTHFVRNVADLTDWIAGAGIHVTGLDTNDRRPGYARQKRWFHAPLSVRWNDMHAAFSETEQCQGFEHRRVDLLADDYCDRRG
jgi:hypothetical protein